VRYLAHTNNYPVNYTIIYIVRRRKGITMSDNRSSRKDPHELFKEIDGLCSEIDAGLANQLPDKAASDLRRWIRRSLNRSDECLLAVQERKG